MLEFEDEAPPEPVAASVATATAVLSLSVAGFVEIVLAHPLPGAFYAAAVVVLMIATTRALTAARKRIGLSGLVTGAWWLGAALALLALFVIPWNTRKPFLHRLNAIEKGMTRTDVLRIMDGYSLRDDVQAADALVFRHSDDGRFHADAAIVTFAGDAVARVQFSAD